MSPTLATDLDQEVITDPYDSFMRNHLQYYGYFKAPKEAGDVLPTPPRWNGRDQGYLLPPPESDSEKDDSQKLIYSFLLESSVFKSRQIVFDHLEGRLIPRLREPRGLFAAATLSTPPQPPRWPIECEVIKEEIYHIDPRILPFSDLWMDRGYDHPPLWSFPIATSQKSPRQS